MQATPSRDGQELLLWLNNMAEEEVTTKVRFPDLVVASFGGLGHLVLFEDGRADLVVQEGLRGPPSRPVRPERSPSGVT